MAVYLQASGVFPRGGMRLHMKKGSRVQDSNASYYSWGGFCTG